MIDVASLRDLVAYDPESGGLFWKPRGCQYFLRERDCAGWNTKYAEKPAFNTLWPSGYRAGHLFKNTYLAHRVAWALHYGVWPNAQIDHVDGNRSNNTIVNLRVVSPEENQKNVKQRVDNTSGIKGVDLVKASNLWRARIVCGGRRIDLGRFISFEEAAEARRRAEARYGYHRNHGRLG